MSGPSGFGDLPRPFVFRAAHLDGQVIKPGAAFFFDLILFQPPESLLPFFTDTFRELARTGLGPGRGLAQLIAADSLASSSGGLTWNLADGNLDSDRVLLRFLTPTEIKSAGEITSTLDFHSLFCRLRDRISSLRACYQGGALDVDFRAIGQAAKNVDISWSHLHTVSAERRSSRTGQTHSLGGFAGEIEYTGHLAPFLPYLKAGEWTGVGRQTVWGKGHYLLEAARVPGTLIKKQVTRGSRLAGYYLDGRINSQA